MRAKLTTRGVGRWASSIGVRGKFGLTVGEILHAVEYLDQEGLLGGLRMLHCHVGSQIFDIRSVKYVVSELAHLYVELRRAGAPVELLDFCVPRMPRHAVPRFVEVVGELDKTPSGKVRKKAMRDLGVTDTTWDRESVGYVVPR